MIVIFTLLAAFILFCLALASLARQWYMENKENLKPDDDYSGPIDMVRDDVLKEGIDLFECHDPFVEPYFKYN